MSEPVNCLGCATPLVRSTTGYCRPCFNREKGDRRSSGTAAYIAAKSACDAMLVRCLRFGQHRWSHRDAIAIGKLHGLRASDVRPGVGMAA